MIVSQQQPQVAKKQKISATQPNVLNALNREGLSDVQYFLERCDFGDLKFWFFRSIGRLGDESSDELPDSGWMYTISGILTEVLLSLVLKGYRNIVGVFCKGNC